MNLDPQMMAAHRPRLAAGRMLLGAGLSALVLHAAPAKADGQNVNFKLTSQLSGEDYDATMTEVGECVEADLVFTPPSSDSESLSISVQSGGSSSSTSSGSSEISGGSSASSNSSSSEAVVSLENGQTAQIDVSGTGVASMAITLTLRDCQDSAPLFPAESFGPTVTSLTLPTTAEGTGSTGSSGPSSGNFNGPGPPINTGPPLFDCIIPKEPKHGVPLAKADKQLTINDGCNSGPAYYASPKFERAHRHGGDVIRFARRERIPGPDGSSRTVLKLVRAGQHFLPGTEIFPVLQKAR